MIPDSKLDLRHYLVAKFVLNQQRLHLKRTTRAPWSRSPLLAGLYKHQHYNLLISISSLKWKHSKYMNYTLNKSVLVSCISLAFHIYGQWSVGWIMICLGKGAQKKLTHEILMIASLWKRKQSKKVPLRTDSVDRWFFCGQSNYVTLLNSPILNLAVTPDLLRVSLWSNHLKSCKVYHDIQWTFDNNCKFSFEIVFVCSHLGWSYTCMRLYNVVSLRLYIVVPVQSFGFT